MSIALVVPFGGNCPHRVRAWIWLKQRYRNCYPNWQIVEAPAPGGAWSKGAALNPAIAEIDAEITVVIDADVWTDGLHDAIAQIENGVPWAIPHTMVHRLSEAGSKGFLQGDNWEDQPLAQPPYRGLPGGGALVASTAVLRSIPLDSRFVGWGQEDECWAVALFTLLGEPWRGTADLVHLWHPPQQRLSRRRGSRRGWELRTRYMQARHDPTVMRALLEESRASRSAAKSPLHDHPQDRR